LEGSLPLLWFNTLAMEVPMNLLIPNLMELEVSYTSQDAKL
jgi:hypothetical protein